MDTPSWLWTHGSSGKVRQPVAPGLLEIHDGKGVALQREQPSDNFVDFAIPTLAAAGNRLALQKVVMSFRQVAAPGPPNVIVKIKGLEVYDGGVLVATFPGPQSGEEVLPDTLRWPRNDEPNPSNRAWDRDPPWEIDSGIFVGVRVSWEITELSNLQPRNRLEIFAVGIVLV